MLRKSCYFCKRVYQETADITIADFWGIYDYRPSNKDQEGISLVLDHTGKFKALFSHIKNECVIEEVPLSSLGYIYEEAKDREPLYTEREINGKCIKAWLCQDRAKRIKTKYY